MEPVPKSDSGSGPSVEAGPSGTCPKDASRKVVVPRILKRKAAEVSTCATLTESAEDALKELPQRKNASNVKHKCVCAVACCKGPYEQEVSFHRFPKDPAVRKAWKNACRRKDEINLNVARVCSRHFSAEDLERDMKAELLHQERRIKLKQGAIPSLLLVPSASPCTQESQRSRRAEKRQQQDMVESLMDEEVEIGMDVSFHEEEPLFKETACQTEEDPLQKENSALKAYIHQLKNELKQAQAKGEKEKVAIAKEVMSQTSWSEKQIAHFIDDKKRTRWSSEDIVRGLTLRGMSKKTYQFLRENKLLPLPSLWTLKQHIRTFTCPPGIQQGVLNGNKLLVFAAPQLFQTSAAKEYGILQAQLHFLSFQCPCWT